MKLAVNLPLLVYWQALGEALTICKPLNLPADRLIDILSDTAGAPAAMKGRGAVIAKVLGGAPLGETAFGLNAAKKDLPPRFNSPPRSTPSFRSPQARWPALRRPKRRAWRCRCNRGFHPLEPAQAQILIASTHPTPTLPQQQSPFHDRSQEPLWPHRRPHP